MPTKRRAVTARSQKAKSKIKDLSAGQKPVVGGGKMPPNAKDD
jgi:hypothetical protein